LRGTALKLVEAGRVPPLPTARHISGEVADIGVGGLCLLTADRTEIAGPLRCEILAPQMPVGIPTLMQVRWADASADGHMYRVGMQFLV
jgi:hypothetical protein